MGAGSKVTLLARLIALGHSEERARAYVLGGRVRVGGEVCTHAGREIDAGLPVAVDEPSPYPSRGAIKLKGALEAFGVDVSGRVALDVGAAHGGFTAVLLERGARRVYAVDVAYGMLDFRLRTDERVVVLERRNVRQLATDWFLPADLSDPRPWIFTADLSFISLGKVLPVLARLGSAISAGWEGVLLIKPQFENSAGTDRGVLRDPILHEEALRRVEEQAASSGMSVLGRSAAAVRGARGNQEVFLHVGALQPG